MNVRIAARVGLIFTLRTVFVAVTLPRLRNTATRLTSEMIVRAHTLSAIAWLVRPVGTVVIPIANPYSRNALVIAAALILIRGAGQRWTILFVFTKRTVDVTIAALI